MALDKYFTVENFNKWIAENPDKLHIIDCFGYDLHIGRFSYFDKKSQEIINHMPVFTGTTMEEIVIKMYQYCFENISYNNKTKLRLYNYFIYYWDRIKTIPIRYDGLTITYDGDLVVMDNEGNRIVITLENVDKYYELFIRDVIYYMLNSLSFFSETTCMTYVKKRNMI